DRGQRGRDVGPNDNGTGCGIELMAQQLLRPPAAWKRCLAGKQKIERAAETVQVAANISAAAVLGSLRRHVIGRARAACQVRAIGQSDEFSRNRPGEACKAQIKYFYDARLGDQQLRRFDVSMDQAPLMGILQAEGCLPDMVTSNGHGQRT